MDEHVISHVTTVSSWCDTLAVFPYSKSYQRRVFEPLRCLYCCGLTAFFTPCRGVTFRWASLWSSGTSNSDSMDVPVHHPSHFHASCCLLSQLQTALNTQTSFFFLPTFIKYFLIWLSATNAACQQSAGRIAVEHWVLPERGQLKIKWAFRGEGPRLCSPCQPKSHFQYMQIVAREIFDHYIKSWQQSSVSNVIQFGFTQNLNSLVAKTGSLILILNAAFNDHID